MSETWLGLAIGGAALAVALPMAIAHYCREWHRARLLRNLHHLDWWYAPYPRKGRRRSSRVARRGGATRTGEQHEKAIEKFGE
ncbi:conserved exported hypothetical protein [Paraburkholderia ribeironis]|uniref:Transmembrane protein n=1 Tax=Paraburkholderia ribeironis TaxID=1247936 RepID=A0A1N7S7R2_9BURK|nr:hypothetical protein [Paraburkholderia ribeironis]SIT43445.1 conserved exported hypothetical protein [Paraburkholderia ribeironis]